MEINYIQQLFSLFKNKTLNAVGAERSLYELLRDKDVPRAISLMDDHSKEVDKAIKEYNPALHEVMNRPNKPRKKERPYITEKLPRNRQSYINEVELFFLLGKPVKWERKEGTDNAYQIFKQYLDDTNFNSYIRLTKRLAGAETESAIIYNITRTPKEVDGKIEYEVTAFPFVASRSLGYSLRPMFDQYGKMLAFGLGYRLKTSAGSVEHWDIHTKDYIFKCKREAIGWSVTPYPNPTGKINVLYFKQPKAWAGVEPRLKREEMLDSKTGDTNNYFSDPMAAATADVLQNMAEPDKAGRMIQLTGANSRFEYINPPQNSQTRESEKEDLKESILFDTFTPDLSYDNIKGLGSLSGAAMHNALILGYMKRDVRKEVYDAMLKRFFSVTIEILKLLHPEQSGSLDRLKVRFEFAEPFEEDTRNKWSSIAELFQAGLVSRETAVKMLALTDNPDAEIDRIVMAQAELKEEEDENAAPVD